MHEFEGVGLLGVFHTHNNVNISLSNMELGLCTNTFKYYFRLLKVGKGILQVAFVKVNKTDVV